MSERTITAKLTPGRPGTVQASVPPQDVGATRELEDLAHAFMLALPGSDLAPGGMTLVESGISPDDGCWVTVWAVEGGSDGEGELCFTFNDGSGTEPLSKSDKQEKGASMASSDYVPTRLEELAGFDGVEPQHAQRMRALASDIRGASAAREIHKTAAELRKADSSLTALQAAERAYSEAMRRERAAA